MALPKCLDSLIRQRSLADSMCWTKAAAPLNRRRQPGHCSRAARWVPEARWSSTFLRSASLILLGVSFVGTWGTGIADLLALGKGAVVEVID